MLRRCGAPRWFTRQRGDHALHARRPRPLDQQRNVLIQFRLQRSGQRRVVGASHAAAAECTRRLGGQPADGIQPVQSKPARSGARLRMQTHRVIAGSGPLAGKGRRLKEIPKPMRLALEMSLHEAAERRALEGELAMLEAAWKEADEIAGIADNLLLPAEVEGWLSRLKRRI